MPYLNEIGIRQIFHLDAGEVETEYRSVGAPRCCRLACFWQTLSFRVAVYLMRAAPSLVRLMARQIRTLTDAKADKRFSCIFVPAPSGGIAICLLLSAQVWFCSAALCMQALESEGLHGTLLL
jgi:uncharacterized membrane protein YbhN (UPF0104 family)